MNRTFKTRWLLALAAGAVPLLTVTSITSAQVRSNNDGAARDASNRVGSGGRNEGPTAVDNRANSQRATGNQIVTGNVTGGKEFRDTVPYTDPNEFRQSTGVEQSTGFIRESTSIGDVRRGNVSPNAAQPFYDPGRTAQTPAGFQPAGPGIPGGYVPTPPPPNTMDNAAGFQNTLQPLSPIPRPGELVLPGPTDENGQSLLTASPLYGVRQWRPGQPNDQQFLSDLSNSFTGRRGNGLDPAELQRMREEMSVPAEGDAQQDDRGASNALDSRPVSSAVNPQSVDSARVDPQAQSNTNADTGQRTRTRILAGPEKQSPQYAEMRRRLEKFNNDKSASDQEAHQAYVQAQRVREATQQQQQPQPGQQQQPGAGTSETAGTGVQRPVPAPLQKPDDAAARAEQTNAERLGLPDFAKQSEQTLRGEKPQAKPGEPAQPGAATPTRRPRPEPVKVPSLAQGVTGKGFGELLSKAEALMKEGKFTSALDQYDRAEQVAPNNPLVKLGRANAELGASYYSRADAHLREAFTADPALLIGQYDLRAFYGEDRLRTLVNDLKEIARTEERQARPVFLLAYIAYNTANERMAAGYLDLAEKRGGNDPLYKLIREHWKLPDDAPPADVETPAPGTTDLNK